MSSQALPIPSIPALPLAFPGGGLGSLGAELREAMTAFCIALPGFWALGELALALLG